MLIYVNYAHVHRQCSEADMPRANNANTVLPDEAVAYQCA